MKALLVLLTVSFSITAFADNDIYDTSSFEYNDYTAQAPTDTNTFSEVSKAPVRSNSSSQNETVEISTAASANPSNTADLNDQELADLGISQNEIAQRTTASGETVATAQNPDTDKSFQIKLRRSRK